MRMRSIITTLIGVAIAGGSVYVAKEQMLDRRGAAIASNSELVEVVVARSDIAYGQEIDRHVVKMQAWPREAVPLGAFLDQDNLISATIGDKRRAKSKIFAGEVLLESKISGFGDKITLVQRLGKNSRAMSVKVDAVTAVGGFVTPGDFVDIVLTQGRGTDMNAVTILQNIRVIGVDQQSGESVEQPGIARTITVEVTPEQGQKLALAQKAGTLSLTLRTLDSVEDKPLDMVNLNDLLIEKSPVPETEKAPTIKLRRGTEVVEIIR